MPMRQIDYIVVHCTGTPKGVKPDALLSYWKEHLGWRSPGYHFLIDTQGVLHKLHPIEKPSNGVAGHNAKSIHVSYVGGGGYVNGAKFIAPQDDRSSAQKATMVDVLKQLKRQFPKAEILGHRDFPNVKKACPSFDAKTEYKALIV